MSDEHSAASEQSPPSRSPSFNEIFSSGAARKYGLTENRVLIGEIRVPRGHGIELLEHEDLNTN